MSSSLTLTGDHRRDLDDWIDVCLWKYTCAHIVGSQVLEFKDERTLLLEWRNFVEMVDPDMIIGYNISNFP
jgi:DNA polymerase elongation subunit (family B)